jgi:phosphate transport system substrate-binding protein
MRTILVACGVLLAAGVPLVAQQINAAGATFPMPMYQKWFGEYRTAHPDVQINYGGGGSGAGIKQLSEGTVDFGASDKPMSDAEIGAMKVKPLHFPTVMGAVVLIYNLKGVAGDLKFTPEAIAGIFMGTVAKWNDPAIARENPGVKLPAGDIIPIHRADSSGTTFCFTDYLSKVSPQWKSKVGADTKVSWPAEGLNGPQNDGVAGLVKQTEGSVGYVELIYALKNKMNYGLVKNAAGSWIKPTLDGVTAAAAGAIKDIPADFRVSITNAPGKDSYPISTMTWMLIPSHFNDGKKAAAMKGFLTWMLGAGQNECADLAYARLPKAVIDKEVKQIAMIN